MGEGGQLVEDGLNTAGLGIGEEHLAEAVAADEGDESLDTEEVEFVEDVVEEQYRLLPGVVEHVLELSEFESECETFLLALGAEFLDGEVGGGL